MGEREVEKPFPSFFFVNEDLSGHSENPQISTPWKWGRRGFGLYRVKVTFLVFLGRKSIPRRESQFQV